MKNDVLQLSSMRQAASSGEARAIRQAARLSLGDVAGVCGVYRSTVYRWETGERVPRGEAATRYANLLDALRVATTTKAAS